VLALTVHAFQRLGANAQVDPGRRAVLLTTSMGTESTAATGWDDRVHMRSTGATSRRCFTRRTAAKHSPVTSFFFENLYPVCGRIAPLAKECDRPRWFFPCARCSAIRYIEGCFHAFGTAATAWPGQVVGTGFEDYFESAFWFGAAGNAPNTPNA